MGYNVIYKTNCSDRKSCYVRGTVNAYTNMFMTVRKRIKNYLATHHFTDGHSLNFNGVEILETE